MGDINWGEVDWEDIVPRLLLYSKMKLRRLKGEAHLLGANEEDFTSQAIEKTISGLREWKKGDVSLIEHLMGVVSSDIYNEFRKSSKYVSSESIGDLLKRYPSNEKKPDESLQNSEEINRFREYLKKKDALLFEYFLLAGVYGMRSDEVEKHMGVNRNTIYGYKKKLRRLADSWDIENKDS